MMRWHRPWSSRTWRMALAGVLVPGLVAAAPATAPSDSWSVVPSANHGYTPQLNSVSCVSVSVCMAVGSYQKRDVLPPTYVLGSYTLAESWNGAGWSVLPTPSPGSVANRAAGSWLRAVSCPSARTCLAVGGYQARDGRYFTLAVRWNGAGWSVLPGPSLTPRGCGLFGVSCVSDSACTAVGLTFTNRATATLIESWNGARWSVVPAPSPGSADILDSVSCVSASACTAVGARAKRGLGDTLIESWNGTSWSLVPSPNAGSYNILYGVSCLSASVCAAVGYREVKAVPRTLAESWNGTKWSLLPSPNAGSSASWNYLDGVSCTAARACTATGEYQDPRQSYKTLVESWNGTNWSLAPSPNVLPPPGWNELNGGVSCVSAGTCTAVGRYYYTKPRSRVRTLIESETPPGRPQKAG
jgi:hypothetical protein